MSRNIGQLAEVIGRGVGSTNPIISSTLLTVFPLIVELIIVATVLLTQFDAIFMVVIFATFAAFGIVMVMGAEIHGVRQRRAIDEFTKSSGRAWDSLFNYETIKYFGAERRMDREIGDALRKWEKMATQSSAVRSVSGLATVLVLGGGVTLLLWMAGHQTLSGDMSVGGLVLINAYLLQIIMPLEHMAQMYRDTKMALINMEKLMVLLGEVPDIVDAPGAEPLPVGGGEISVRDVSFWYGAKRQVLNGISFDVPAGTTTGLVGPSGAGKSTIARLLFRFYDPSQGSIHIDGQDLRGLKVDSVRAAIGVVPQDTVLFNNTLGRNIGFSVDDPSAKDVEWATRMAKLDDFVSKLPDGLRNGGGRTRPEVIGRRKTAGRHRPGGFEKAAHFPV